MCIYVDLYIYIYMYIYIFVQFVICTCKYINKSIVSPLYIYIYPSVSRSIPHKSYTELGHINVARPIRAPVALSGAGCGRSAWPSAWLIGDDRVLPMFFFFGYSIDWLARLHRELWIYLEINIGNFEYTYTGNYMEVWHACLSLYLDLPGLSGKTN